MPFVNNHVFLKVSEDLSHFDVRALDLQVDDSVPDLARLLRAEHAGLTLVVLMQVLKDKAMPKLVILPGSFISETPDQAAVLLLRKQQNATLNPQVQVVNEKPV